MKINNELKTAINKLQLHLESETESDNVLIIFDNEAELLKYRRAHNYMCPDQILITIEELYMTNRLDSLRYKRYLFKCD